MVGRNGVSNGGGVMVERNGGSNSGSNGRSNGGVMVGSDVFIKYIKCGSF